MNNSPYVPALIPAQLAKYLGVNMFRAKDMGKKTGNVIRINAKYGAFT
jgi:hypothetical protein